MTRAVTAKLHRRRVRSTRGRHLHHAMKDDATLQRVEAMLINLRDQLDELTERVDARLAEQGTQLQRVRRELQRVKAKTLSDSMLVRHAARPLSST